MRRKIVILFFLLALFVFFVTWYISLTNVLIEQEIFASLIVGERIGFDLNTSALTFGMITNDSSSTRNLVIENNYDFPIIVNLYVEGDIKKFLNFDKITYIDVKESRVIGISAVNKGEDYGMYEGIIRVVLKRDI